MAACTTSIVTVKPLTSSLCNPIPNPEIPDLRGGRHGRTEKTEASTYGFTPRTGRHSDTPPGLTKSAPKRRRHQPEGPLARNDCKRRLNWNGEN